MKWQKARQVSTMGNEFQHYPDREFWALPERHHSDEFTVGPDGRVAGPGDFLATNIIDDNGNRLYVMADTVEFLGYDSGCFADDAPLIPWEEFIR